MSTAKPQHLSNDVDSSDDLIAELAKLMAQDAQGERPSPAIETSKPVAAMADAPTPAGPTSPVRIPGIKDAPNSGTPQPDGVAPLRFDFGRPPAAAPLVTPEPLVWQDTATAKPATPQHDAAGREEPGFAASISAPPAQGRLPAASVAADAGDFDFGFGVGQKQPESQPEPHVGQPRTLEPLASIEPVSTFDPVPKLQPAPETAAVPVRPNAPPIVEERDVIADLIAAELAAEKPRPVAVSPVSAAPQNNAWANVSALAAKPVPKKPASGPVLRSVNLTPKTGQENDKFVTAPVFGLTGVKPVVPKPVASIPHDDLDPIDEIESLIGEAVRVELGTPRRAEVAAPAATVTPLNTQLAQRRPVVSEPDARNTLGAEDAILAAAAVTGAEVGRIETGIEEPEPKRRRAKKEPRAARPPGNFRQYVGPAVAGTLLLLAGFGLYWVLGMSRGDASAPVLTADVNPVKAAPETPVVDASTTQGSVVFDQLDGIAGLLEPETLVSRDQTDGEDIARVVTPESEESAETLLANRKVRTVTVRPDGTIVSGDDAVAGTSELPVDRPNVPELPGSATALDAATDLLADVNPTDAATETGSLPADASALTTGAAAIASEDVAPGAVDPNVPIPMPRPNWRGNSAALEAGSPVNAIVEQAPLALVAADEAPVTALVTGPVVAVAAIDPVVASDAGPVDVIGDIAAETAVATELSATPVTAVIAETPVTEAPEAALTEAPPAVEIAAVEPVVETPAPSNAAAWVQLSSQRTEADAQSTLTVLESQYGALFGGVPLEIQRTDLGAKGIYYRVRLPTTSLEIAVEVCREIKRANGDCFAL